MTCLKDHQVQSTYKWGLLRFSSSSYFFDNAVKKALRTYLRRLGGRLLLRLLLLPLLTLGLILRLARGLRMIGEIDFCDTNNLPRVRGKFPPVEE